MKFHRMVVIWLWIFNSIFSQRCTWTMGTVIWAEKSQALFFMTVISWEPGASCTNVAYAQKHLCVCVCVCVWTYGLLIVFHAHGRMITSEINGSGFRVRSCELSPTFSNSLTSPYHMGPLDNRGIPGGTGRLVRMGQDHLCVSQAYKVPMWYWPD